MTVAAMGAVVMASCTGDGGDPQPVNLTEISGTPPDGAQVCGFVPRESVATVLSTADFEVRRGDVVRDNSEELTSASCHVALDGQEDTALDISVDWALGSVMSGFEEDLQGDRYNPLPEEDGLGFSWTQEANRPDGSRGDTARAWLVHGDRLIRVWITMPVEGRDAEADAVAIAQQVTRTLELSDEWTLPGEPPSR